METHLFFVDARPKNSAVAWKHFETMTAPNFRVVLDHTNRHPLKKLETRIRSEKSPVLNLSGE
jgi:hypothetical protein